MEIDLSQIYMNTVTGRKVAPFAMKPADVDLRTIAHHLAVQPRWQGATVHPSNNSRLLLSVAEHSLMVLRYVEEKLQRPDLALQALLHDAPEAYLSDMIRPLKYSPVFKEPFLELEQKVWVAIADRFALPHDLDPLIKVADNAVCQAEWEQVVPHAAGEICMCDSPEAAPYQVEMLQPVEAMSRFMEAIGKITRREAKLRKAA